MFRSVLATGTAIVSLCPAFATIAHAQATDAATATATATATAVAAAPGGPVDAGAQADPAEPRSDIIVTGSTRAQRRFDASYAINTLSQADIEKIAPAVTSDADCGAAAHCTT